MPIILFALVVVIGIITWLVSQEGVWGAASILVCVVLSGLFAMNFFEPLTLFLTHFLPGLANYADFASLIGLFAGSMLGLRLLSEYLLPNDIRVPDLLDNIGKWGFAAAAGYVTMAFLLAALHTAPLPREFLGFRPEDRLFFGIPPDRQWLGFTQYVSERSLQRLVGPPNIFDGMYRKIGDLPEPKHPSPNLSSFPIRYAARRAEIEKGNVVAGAVINAAPPPVPRPAGGGAPAAGGF